MTRSSDEREIRDYVVDRLRRIMPNARIVHELNVAGQGTNRIDVAAITPTAIVGVEIKSKKDTLKRLEEQWAAFSKCCHFVIVAAHEKHFKPYSDRWYGTHEPPLSLLDHPLFFGASGKVKQRHIWPYPEPEPTGRLRPWNVFDPLQNTLLQPRAYNMLDMLWADELRRECERHRIDARQRRPRHDMIQDMVWLMTGKEIAHAVCRQLRARRFAEADPPVLEMADAVSVAPSGQMEMCMGVAG
ncbi:hypothetical protein [Ciceribacter sp. L1K22]|uniref:hypothetical protein n=1 Tax=Ciceribacter sp. L1K22 TaxID=2820275 RepID=UPI001ABE70DA|nr:hypothetical protein [Ciceribacter sp. L1K22]MBO3760373.1 hypothetical protein [Ciceribacter sp. L1K22]